MHLPDGFLTPAVWVPAAAISSLTVAYANRGAARVPRCSPGRVASLTAFVFAGQALQFPIPGGASGHLLGGTLLAAMLGPAPAILAMATVFTIQAAVFHDGGLTVLGANLLNGGILPIAVGQLVMGLTRRAAGRGWRSAAAGAAAFLGILTGAAACSLEVAASGTAPLAPFLGAMLASHAWIGLAEAAITASLVQILTAETAASELADTEPVAPPPRQPLSPRAWVSAAAILTVVAASEFASSRAPDGLESAARALGLPVEGAPLTDVPSPAAAMAASALGALGCGLVVLGVLRFSRSRLR